MKAHALMISVPFQGHINPFVNLALNLASKGFTITFVHLEYVHHKLAKAHKGKASHEVDFFSEARQSGLDIRYTMISDGRPLEFDRDLDPMEYWIYLLHDFPAHVDEFVEKMIRSDPLRAPDILVTDTIYAWSAAIAKKYNLVNVSFWTEPALVFSLLYHLDLLKEKGHFLCKDEEEIDYVPGVQSISTKDLMTSLTSADDLSGNTLFIAFEGAKKADFVLHNTVHELEYSTLSALNEYQPTYAVGPINFYGINSTAVSNSLNTESDCTSWLDSKPPGSVLYVSFGSIVQLSKEVIGEIARGLLLSGLDFIWVVRSGIAAGSGDAHVLPVGFEDEVRDRGLVIPWCNQIEVLSNPAVGGFLTHNGWNSTLESMWCGVPMICYPIAYDQPSNRKLVVDDWNVGISLCDGKSVNGKEVAEKLRSFMSGAVSEKLRKEAENVKQILRNALEIGGSSNRNFDQFIQDVEKKLCLQ